MAEPRPANDSAPIRPSLFDRAIGAARVAPRAPLPPPAPDPMPAARIDRAAAALAVAIVATPLFTLFGATILTGQVRDETRALTARSAPVADARAARDHARAMLSAAWTAPTLGSTIEAIARALPDDAALLRVERNPRLRIEIAAPDPDRAVNALRRDPALGQLRPVAQSRVDGDGRMRVTLEEAQ